MKSHLTDDFIDCFQKLPDRIKRIARENYQLWVRDSNHPSLSFKKVNKKPDVYSIRIGLGWRALAYQEDGTFIWFWIGPHSEYEREIKKF